MKDYKNPLIVHVDLLTKGTLTLTGKPMLLVTLNQDAYTDISRNRRTRGVGGNIEADGMAIGRRISTTRRRHDLGEFGVRACCEWACTAKSKT